MDEHVGVYASKADGHMVKAEHPKSLLHGSPVSASLAAAIMNGKYVNAVPLYRLEQEFIRYGLAITRQNMANCMIIFKCCFMITMSFRQMRHRFL